MIIQALNEYYQRLKNDSDSNIPLFGFSREKIYFVLVVDKSGKFVAVNDLREKNNKKLVPKQIIVPAGSKKSVNIQPNFLWGNTGYVLGADKKEHKDKDRPQKMFKAFKDFQHLLGDNVDDEAMRAVLKFFDYWNPVKVVDLEYWKEMAGMNVVFQLDGEHRYIHEHSSIQEKWLEYCREKQSKYKAFCLVSGQKRPIARLHPSIKRVRNTQPSGASIVSFNFSSVWSYHKDKKQGLNAPVSEDIAFNYTTALNNLLQFDSRKWVQIGDATTVFWAEGKTPAENFLKDILDPHDNQANLDLRIFLEAVREGKMPKEIEDAKNMKFYILGLSPNASRISVRFWYVSTVEDISRKIGQHFKDLKIIKSYETDPEYPGMWHLLREIAVRGKTKNVSPLLAGALIRSIITGVDYPLGILTAVLTRIRADQKINYLRTALIKACLVRSNRNRNQKEKEVISMALDKEKKDIGYRLGRLFSILEKAQKDAVPGANTTIKDRFYGSASATPAVVFPQLLRLAQHHIQKSDFKVHIDKQIEEVVQDIEKFPSYLSLEEQGMFAIGYYHQKQDFYKKKEQKEE